MKKRNVILAGVICIFLIGCASGKKKTAEVAPVKSEQESQLLNYVIAKKAEGSLWSEVEAVSLYPDRRARRIGDIVNVRIVEDPTHVVGECLSKALAPQQILQRLDGTIGSQLGRSLADTEHRSDLAEAETPDVVQQYDQL